MRGLLALLPVASRWIFPRARARSLAASGGKGKGASSGLGPHVTSEVRVKSTQNFKFEFQSRSRRSVVVLYKRGCLLRPGVGSCRRVSGSQTAPWR